MRSILLATAGAIAVLGVAGAGLVQGLGSSAIASDPSAANEGPRIENFELTDHTRMAQQLYYYRYAPAIVIMTRTNGSAYSKAGAVALQKLAGDYAAKGVLFFMLDSNDSRDSVAAEAARQGITIPVLMDEYQLVGEQLGVQREGEVFVINPKTWRAVYHGPLDDRFASAAPTLGSAPGDAYAAKAIDGLLAGGAVQASQVAMTAGRTIAFPGRAKAAAGDFAKVSYARDIAPILQDKCVSCHIAGGIGPFAMDGYDVVQRMAPMIRETIRTRRMPPYFADPHIGAFQHDQSLSPEQAKLLVHWVEAGAPRGTGTDPLLANAGKTAPEWPASLGKPDVVVKLPAFNVPATGVIEYQYVRVDNPFTENTWLRAIAIKPGDRSVLHHVVSNYVPDRTAPPASIPGGSVGSYTPGAEPQIMADNSGAPVPAGGKLNFQMHYTTTGKATVDATQVGFYVLKTPPKYIKRSAVIGGFNLYIPAGEARHQEVAYLTFPADAYLYTLFPHAHYRGMHVELKERTADGKETMLLSLPKYDFNWQRDYDPVHPILIKAGTKLIATWVYDNSVHNKANPDPTRNVTWGEQTPDEMMYFRVNYRWADETVAHPRGDLQAKLMASMMMGGLDANLDGVLEKSELHGPMGAQLLAHFDELDKDHDGTLDATELAAVAQRRGHRGQTQAQAQAQATPDL